MLYKSVLKNRMVLYYLTSAGISQLGNVLSSLAFLFLAYELTQSARLTTIIAISQAVPYLFFGLVGGAVADRINKKQLLLGLDFIRVPVILSLVVFYQLEILAFWHLILISFLVQSIGCFYNPALRAVLPLITPIENQTAVNSLLDIVTRGMQVLSPIFSIILLSTGQTIHLYSIDALTYFISAFFILQLKWAETNDTERSIENKNQGIFQSIYTFFQWADKNRMIKTLFKVTFLIVFFNTWVWQIGLLLLLLKNYTENGEEIYTLLLSWYGAGVIFINFIVPLIWNKMNLTIYLSGSLVWGIGIVVIGCASHLPVYFIGMFIAAIGLPISGLARVYLIQTLVPSEKLGRAFSFNAVLLYGSNVISLTLFGVLSSFIEIQTIFIFCGSMMVFISLFYLIRIGFPEKAGRKPI